MRAGLEYSLFNNVLCSKTLERLVFHILAKLIRFYDSDGLGSIRSAQVVVRPIMNLWFFIMIQDIVLIDTSWLFQRKSKNDWWIDLSNNKLTISNSFSLKTYYTFPTFIVLSSNVTGLNLTNASIIKRVILVVRKICWYCFDKSETVSY